MGDGTITVATPDVDRLGAVIEAFRERAPGAPVHAEAQSSFDGDDESATGGAYDQWRTTAVPASVTQNLRTTARFDAVGETLTGDAVA